MISRSRNKSLADLKKWAGDSPPRQIMLQLMYADSHKRLLAAVEAAIDHIGQQMTKLRQAYQDKSEDELTIYIVQNLVSMGFNASHDTEYGGHCDIVVEEKNNFLWIAEAKKHSTYKWLNDGLKQLTTRYATGTIGQDAGDLLIYFFGERLDLTITEWESRLRKDYPGIKITRCANDEQVLRTIHLIKGTGRKFTVRHKGIALYFRPEK